MLHMTDVCFLLQTACFISDYGRANMQTDLTETSRNVSLPSSCKWMTVDGY